MRKCASLFPRPTSSTNTIQHPHHQENAQSSQNTKHPHHATTQNAARLGDTCSELDISSAVALADKSAFSMWVPAISKHFDSSSPSEIVIVGIESHICVTQTTMDALAAGHKVYILADGVGSCNREEVPIALARLRELGAVVTSSESFIYECMGDAGIPE